MSNPGRVILGVITGAYGVRGAVRLKSFTGKPEAIASYGAVTLGDSGREMTIRVLKPAREELIAALDGIGDRSAAEALKGCTLHVARDRLPPPGDGEVYVSDMIGLPVYRKDGSLLGAVAAVADYGAGDLLEITSSDRRGSILIPFVTAMVPEVDVANRRIVVDPPEGLIEAQEQP
jgi:16S rRNA processing protein RimM